MTQRYRFQFSPGGDGRDEPAQPDPGFPGRRRSHPAAHEPAGPGTPAGSPEQQAEIARLTAEVERLSGEADGARAQADERLADLQRTLAEFANYRRRTAEEREREAGQASESLLRKVLALADDFDRAIDAMPAELRGNTWVEGVGAIDRKLRVLLEGEGVKVIEVLGRPFDPREHEAIAGVPGTGRPDGEVVGELQRGYRLRDRILRPALVAVAAGGDAGPPAPGANSAPQPPHPHTH